MPWLLPSAYKRLRFLRFCGTSFRFKSLPFVLVVSTFAICSPAATTQSQPIGTEQKDFTRIIGTEDEDLLVPTLSVAPMQKDPSALQAVANFLSAINGGAWRGMEATGTVTQPGATEQYPALLTAKGDSFRLDINGPEGQRSVRIHGIVGTILESDGKKHTLPPTMASDGFIAFPALMIAGFPGAQTSILDRGAVVVGGQSLRRITIQQPVSSTSNPLPTDQPNVVDLYFDPATHLLLKSVKSVQLDTADRARYLLVMTYSDYRNVDGMLLPFAYSQTLNGQRQWSLQLATIQMNSNIDTSLFAF